MITKDMIIADFMEQYPEKVYILREIGFPCIGCFLSAEETLEMGCMEAGIDVYELIDKSIVEEPPISVKEGGIIKKGYNTESYNKFLASAKPTLDKRAADEKLYNKYIKTQKDIAFFEKEDGTEVQVNLDDLSPQYQDLIKLSKTFKKVKNTLVNPRMWDEPGSSSSRSGSKLSSVI